MCRASGTQRKRKEKVKKKKKRERSKERGLQTNKDGLDKTTGQLEAEPTKGTKERSHTRLDTHLGFTLPTLARNDVEKMPKDAAISKIKAECADRFKELVIVGLAAKGFNK